MYMCQTKSYKLKPGSNVCKGYNDLSLYFKAASQGQYWPEMKYARSQTFSSYQLI